MPYIRVDAEVDMHDIDWTYIVDHVEDCGYCIVNPMVIKHIVETKDTGGDWESLMRDFVYDTTGKYWS